MNRVLSTATIMLVLLLCFLILPGVPSVRAAPWQQVQLPTAVVQFSMVNLFARLSQSSSIMGIVAMGQVCTIEGRNELSTWLLVNCNGVRGWIDRRLVAVRGDLSTVSVITPEEENIAPTPTPTPTPIPPPTPTPPAFQGWRASYFNGASPQGVPVLVRDVPAVSFDWGYQSPAPIIPVDYFSARFERTINFVQGYYRFVVTADDGVRVRIDDTTIIEEWHGATGREYATSRWLAGNHRVTVEYLELVALASIRFDYYFSPDVPPWQADYYSGAPYRGNLLYSQREATGPLQLDRNWGSGSPVPGSVPSDYWNGRWTGQFQFENGNYLFRARSADGVRVYIDNIMVIDAWLDGYVDRTNRFLGVGAGQHTMIVDYYDRTQTAFLQVWWYRDTSGPVPSP